MMQYWESQYWASSYFHTEYWHPALTPVDDTLACIFSREPITQFYDRYLPDFIVNKYMDGVSTREENVLIKDHKKLQPISYAVEDVTVMLTRTDEIVDVIPFGYGMRDDILSVKNKELNTINTHRNIDRINEQPVLCSERGQHGL